MFLVLLAILGPLPDRLAPFLPQGGADCFHLSITPRNRARAVGMPGKPF